MLRAVCVVDFVLVCMGARVLCIVCGVWCVVCGVWRIFIVSGVCVCV